MRNLLLFLYHLYLKSPNYVKKLTSHIFSLSPMIIKDLIRKMIRQDIRKITPHKSCIPSDRFKYFVDPYHLLMQLPDEFKSTSHAQVSNHYFKDKTFLLDPCPGFASQSYLKNNLDVMRSKKNPLTHYLTHMLDEIRFTDVADSHPFNDEIAKNHLTPDINNQELEPLQITISVIIPTWNRQEQITKAINSVLNQTFKPLEIIISDDGSTDDTVYLIKRTYPSLIDNKFLKIISSDHYGVSRARNIAFKQSSGSIIAYLDSDNSWTPDYLRQISLVYIKHQNIKHIYTDIEVFTSNGSHILSKDFNLRQLLTKNFIDLNGYSHRRNLITTDTPFDEKLTRLVDWELIIKNSLNTHPTHLSYLSTLYDGHHNAKRVTTNAPLLPNFFYIKEKYRKERIYSGSRIKIAIKIATPSNEVKHLWGDYHYAISMQESFFRLFGYICRIDIVPDWYNNESVKDDVVIVLRGLGKYLPNPKSINILWLISHPDKLTQLEADQYDLCYHASILENFRAKLFNPIKFKPLLQASDHLRFCSYRKELSIAVPKILFVGNSRGVLRWIVKTCVDANIDLGIFGSGWDNLVPNKYIKGDYIPNDELSFYYNKATVVLNDMWEDMRESGIVSNRIFDIGMSQGFVISQDFAGSELIPGLVTVKNKTDLIDKIYLYSNNQDKRLQKITELHDYVSRTATFDNRINTLYKDLNLHLESYIH